MIATSSRWSCLAVAIASACAPEPTVEPPTPVETPPPAAPAPAPAVEPAPVVEPAVEPTPVAPAFDPATATSLRVKIVAIHQRDSWVACGRRHTVGALEVEVLAVGEPPPRMILLVSCPVDGGRHGAPLVVGANLDVTLHARKQSWPAVHGLPDLPRRYVETYTGAGAAP